MRNRSVVKNALLLAAVAALFSNVVSAASAQSERPNIVYFNIDDYDDVESRLKAILTRLHDTHGVTHRLDGVFLVETNNSLQKIPGRTSQMRFPFDFEEARRIIKRTPESKLALSISL